LRLQQAAGLRAGIVMSGSSEDTASAIVDRIYEAAFVPDGWPKVLEAISGISDAASSQFMVFSENAPPRGASQANLKGVFDTFIAGDTWKASDSVQKIYVARPANFVVVDDAMTPEEIEHDPARIMLRAKGIGQCLCTAVPLPGGELATFTVQRWLAGGSFERRTIDLLDGIRPHLARAGLMAARLRLEQAQATVSALQAIGLPAAVIAASGRVLATNDLLTTMADIFLPAAHDRMIIGDLEADLLFQQAVAENRRHGVVRSIAVKRDEERPAVVLHVVPLRRQALDIFAGADLLVAATVPAPTAMVPWAGLLTSLFDLTPAEARLAGQLAAGMSLAAAAERAGIGFGTARNYLQRIFRKTGTHQQGQLVALLKTVHPFPAGTRNPTAAGLRPGGQTPLPLP
jgi:DNA-binding CsgD family transcriptional regulator/GAF domain-containing protein